MDPMSILFPVLSVGGMGVVFGACLGVASEVFKVEEDPRICLLYTSPSPRD